MAFKILSLQGQLKDLESKVNNKLLLLNKNFDDILKPDKAFAMLFMDKNYLSQDGAPYLDDFEKINTYRSNLDSLIQQVSTIKSELSDFQDQAIKIKEEDISNIEEEKLKSFEKNEAQFIKNPKLKIEKNDPRNKDNLIEKKTINDISFVDNALKNIKERVSKLNTNIDELKEKLIKMKTNFTDKDIDESMNKAKEKHENISKLMEEMTNKDRRVIEEKINIATKSIQNILRKNLNDDVMKKDTEFLNKGAKYFEKKVDKHKISLQKPDYKYGKDKNRFHAFKTKHLDNKDNNNPLLAETEKLTGDILKRKIIENIKTYIENSLNGDEKKSIKDIVDEIKNNPAYTQILAKGTGIMTRTFGLETSSQKAVDKMLHEAKEQEDLRPKMK